jgi:aromatic ring-opening dioxygenase catalytic subunit (LigB family)
VDPGYGWDHGVFIPLKVMYPQAELPVVAMSLQARLDPTLHHRLGAALRPLRDEGVLLVGSGMSYHNLRDYALAAPLSHRFHDWLEQILQGDAAQRCEQLARWEEALGGPRLAPARRASAAADGGQRRGQRPAGTLPVAWPGRPRGLGGLGLRLRGGARWA